MKESKYGFPIVERNDCFMIPDALNAIVMQLDKVLDDIRREIDTKTRNNEGICENEVILSESQWDYIVSVLNATYHETHSETANSIIFAINYQRRGN